MDNKVQDGNVIVYTNSTGSDIATGDLVIIGSMVGVAAVDIEDGSYGAVDLVGVFELAAVNDAAITLGAPVYVDGSTSKITPTATDNIFAGMAWTAKAETATTVQVKIGGYTPVVES